MQYEIIGCCDSYVACSDARKCLYPEEWFAKKCRYRRNLESGRIFYGRNAEKPGHIEAIKEKLLYLYCYERLFSIRSNQGKFGFSYKLSSEQIDKLTKFFDDKNIPYETNTLDYLCKIENNPPACSRIVIEIDGEKFSILNYNTYLIQTSYAEGISKSFEDRGIKSIVETNHKYSRHRETNKSTTLNISHVLYKPASNIGNEKNTKIEEQYVQYSMFDITEKQQAG